MDSSSFSNPTSCVSTYSLASNEKKTKKGGRGGTKLSTDPQSVAARQRRHRISHRFKILQSLVPGGSKLDTVSMLEEAIQYVKFLKAQIWLHQSMMGLVDRYAGADIDDPSSSSSILPVNSCPDFYDQRVDVCDNVCDNMCSGGGGEQAQAEIELGWPVSCFPGEENIGRFC